jgi:alpha-1,2-mannosyltransferase
VSPRRKTFFALPRWLAYAPLIAGIILLTIAMYRNRGNFAKVSMAEFYDWSWELRAGGNPWLSNHDPAFHAVTGVPHRGHCNYPPAFLIAFEPLTLINVRTAYWIWQAVLIASMITAVAIIVYELGPPPGAGPYTLAIGATLLYPETYGSLYESQLTFLLLAMLVAAFVLDRRRWNAAAGLMFAVATLFKLFPGLAAGYFLVHRRWTTLAWAAAFGLSGLLLTSRGNQHTFLNSGILRSQWLADDGWLRNDRSLAIYSNLRALLDWLNGGPLTGRLVQLWIGLTAIADAIVVAITLFVTARAARSPGADVASFGLWLCAAIIISPISWGHYLPLIIPLLLGLATCAIRCEKPPYVAILLIGLGVLGIYAAYFDGALREDHVFFIATFVIFTGSVLALNSENVSH